MNTTGNERLKRLLIIDDEESITKTIARQFRNKYQVYTANSGEKAIEILKENNVEVIISDQRMPGMTGVNLFSKIKDIYPDALRLILTGYADIDAVINAINDGQIYRYITKPWNPDELDSIVKQAFEKSELIQQNKSLIAALEKSNTQLENKVKERTVELQKLNEQKNKYIGIVAHDLRSPIALAQSFTNLLLSEYDRFEKAKHLEFLNIISERCGYSINLMNNFLNVSKIEAGIFDMNFEKTELIGFIKRSITLTEFLAHSKGQRINLINDIDSIEVNIDKDKVEQIISNLLSNAVKYSTSNTEIQIRLSKDNNSIKIEVTDQGQGIDNDELKDLFNPYRRVSSKPTDNEESVGLGLAIVKKLIEAHNGDISVQSSIGKGSTFKVTLPIN